jgi:carbonic anhydrase
MASITEQFVSTRRRQLAPEDFGNTSGLISSFRQGATPAAVVLTCWDLGGTLDQISHAARDQVLVVQNPGGLVPAGGGEADETISSIGLALQESSVRHLVVCGHRDCATVPLLLDDGKPDYLPEYRNIVAELRNQLRGLDAGLTPRQRSEFAVQETVLQQLVHLRMYPQIQSRLRAGQLRLHGWVYDDRTARIAVYNPFSGRFAL